MFSFEDRLLGDIILEKTDAIVSYHPHDILFDELEDERLNDEVLNLIIFSFASTKQLDKMLINLGTSRGVERL